MPRLPIPCVDSLPGKLLVKQRYHGTPCLGAGTAPILCVGLWSRQVPQTLIPSLAGPIKDLAHWTLLKDCVTHRQCHEVGR